MPPKDPSHEGLRAALWCSMLPAVGLPFPVERLPVALRDPRVLEAMAKVPRARFVSEDLGEEAEADVALPIGFGQTISQPYVVAYMTAALRVSPGHRVLEIGTGSGYQAAVLATMGVEVYTVELLPALAERARRLVDDLGLATRVHFKVGDGWHGWPAGAPYDGVICTAAPTSIPPALIEQLGLGRRLVIPVGPTGAQTLRVLEKGETGLTEQHKLAVAFVPLVRAGIEA